MPEPSSPALPEAAPKSPWLAHAALAAWAIIALVGMASLALPHIVPMPQPPREERLARSLAALRQESGGHFLVHVIAAGCSCTERLFAHLLERRRFAGTEEIIVFVGEDARKAAAARGAGFAYVTVSAAELASRYGLESAPVLLALDAGNRMRYAGGYFSHPSTLVPLDEGIHAALARGEGPEPLPVYGCAVSRGLREAVDPLGIVYPRA
jgi:hypothetical protein